MTMNRLRAGFPGLNGPVVLVTLWCLIIPVAIGHASDLKQIRVPVTGSIGDIIAADLTADGFADIVTIDRGKKKINILVGDAQQKYSRRFSKGYSGLGMRLIGAADFTGDRKIDIAVDSATGSALFAVFPGKGNGELLNPKVIRTASPEPDLGDAVVLDFDGDGRPDVAGLLTYYEYDVPRSVAAFRNLGGGKFSTIKLVEDVIYERMAAGDLNGDGCDDIVVRAEDASTLTLFLADGAGSFLQGRTIDVRTRGSSVVVGDVNGDRKLDLAGEGLESPYGWVLLGKGNGTFGKQAPIPGSAGALVYDMVLADVTADGKTDLVASVPGPYNSRVTLYPGSGSARLGKPIDLSQVDEGFFTHCSSGRNLCVADVNKDSQLDVAAAHYMNWTGYDNPNSYEMQNVLLLVNGAEPVKLAISNLQFTTLSYTSLNVTMVGSFTFEDSGGDVQVATSPTAFSGAFLEFHLSLVFPSNWVSSGNYWVTGSFLQLPGQKAGKISFSLTLPIRSAGVGTPRISVTGFALYDANLVRSNELSWYQ